MRFGLDVAQQRMPWDEVVQRVQLAEELGFDGAWGFDHFQPMYGDGPGETFDGVTTLAALAGQTSRIRLGLLVTGVTYRHPSVFADADGHRRPRVRTAGWRCRSARRGSTRSTRARHPVPAHRRALRPARGRARDHHPAHDRRGRVLRRQGRVAPRRPDAAHAGAGPAPAHLDRRQRPHPHAPARGPLRRRVALLRHAQQHAARRRPASTSWPPRPGATRPTSCGPGRCRLDDLDTARKHAAKWQRRRLRLPRVRLARRRRAPRSRPSPARSCPSSPDAASQPAVGRPEHQAERAPTMQGCAAWS